MEQMFLNDITVIMLLIMYMSMSSLYETYIVIMCISIFSVLHLSTIPANFDQVEIFCNSCLQEILRRQLSAIFKINLSSSSTD